MFPRRQSSTRTSARVGFANTSNSLPRRVEKARVEGRRGEGGIDNAVGMKVGHGGC